MNAKPKEAIERIVEALNNGHSVSRVDAGALWAYLDSIPDACVCVEWPAELTRERLEELAIQSSWASSSAPMEALNALAAIAPVKRKRVVNLWVTTDGTRYFRETYEGNYAANGWKCVARNVELED